MMTPNTTTGSTEDSGKPANAKLHQIGLVWLKNAGDAETRQKVIDAVHDFRRLIPEVKSAAVGPNASPESPYLDTSYDICFVLTFEDDASREQYNEHPVHQKAAKEVFLPLAEKLQFYIFESR
ncbi:MAG: Dabb family protein [Verrucomicrobiae bacterium]|nr:Dabb family protein [Verrucomicrobiae bacterium]